MQKRIVGALLAVFMGTGCATDILLGSRELGPDGVLVEKGIDLGFAWGEASTEPSNTQGGPMSEIFQGAWNATVDAVAGVLGRTPDINQTFVGVESEPDEPSD